MNAKNIVKAFTGSMILLFAKGSIAPIANNFESVASSYVEETIANNLESVTPSYVEEIENLKKLYNLYNEEYGDSGIDFKISYVDYNLDIIEDPINDTVPYGYLLTYDSDYGKNIGYMEKGPTIEVSIDENGNTKIEEFNGPEFIGALSDYYYLSFNGGEIGYRLSTDEINQKLRTK